MWIVFLAGATFLQAQCLRGAFHVHSFRSFDSKGTFEEIKQAAQEAKLDFVVLADHVPLREGQKWALPPSNTTDFLWIDGVEVELANKEDYLVFGCDAGSVAWTKGKEKEGIVEAKKQGCLVFLAHILRAPNFQDFSFIDGIELYNAHDDLWWPQLRIFKLLYLAKYKDSLDELWQALVDYPQRQIDLVQQWPNPFPLIAGNDAHKNVYLFDRQLDPYIQSFHFIQTEVCAKQRSIPSILKTMREGGTSIFLSGQKISYLQNVKDSGKD